MARIKLSPIITDVRGTLGGSLTFQRRSDGHYLVKKPHPRDKQSEAQLEQRTKFLDARDAWQALSLEDKAVWNEEARAGSNMTGYALYVQRYLRGTLVPAGDVDTVFLLQSVDEPEGSIEFTDQSMYGYALTRVRSPSHTRDVGSPAGMGASALDLRSGILQTTDNFPDIYGGDFTIEFWWYLSSGSTRNFLGHSSDTSFDHPFWIRSGSNMQTMWGGFYTVGTIVYDRWQHWCIERSGTRFYGYRDGVLELDIAFSNASYGTPQQLLIGSGRGSTGVNWSGYTQQLRISTVARYGGVNFTPPTELFSIE